MAIVYIYSGAVWRNFENKENSFEVRICSLIFFFSLASTVVWSQQAMPSNSFEASYKKTNPAINYKYDSVRQIHDYSNNWDFDKDSKPDQVYFVGTGGAHLYYFLRVILSTDNLVRDFSFLQSDFPILPSEEQLNKPDFNPKNVGIQFAVFDYTKDNINDIFINLDNTSFEIGKKFLNKKGVKTNYIIVTFKKGKTIFKDFSSKISIISSR